MKKIFTVGVFDAIHIGHLNLLKKGRELGELYVGVVCDEAVKRVKGENRPLIDEISRLELIKNIKGVEDAFLICDFEINKDVIDVFDIILLGGDQEHIIGRELIPDNKKIIHQRTENISTSDIIKKMKE